MENSTKPLLTVVVPTYNVVLYLEQCLESIFKQGLTEEQLEVLVVNDGSTDGSELLAEKIARSHSSVKVVTQPNAGLSAARNTGLAAATGEFLTFLDSDDVIPDFAYLEMLNQLQRSGSDFITGPAQRFSSRQRRPWAFNRNLDLFFETRSGLRFEEHPEFIRDFTAWNKIYRRQFFLDSGVIFPVGRIYEDVATTPMLYNKSNTFDVWTGPAYYWRVTPGGITQTIKPVKAMDRIWALWQVVEHFSQESSRNVRDEMGFAIVDYNLRWVLLEYHKFDADTQAWILQQSAELLALVRDEVIDRVQAPLNQWAQLAKERKFSELHDVLMQKIWIRDLPIAVDSNSDVLAGSTPSPADTATPQNVVRVSLRKLSSKARRLRFPVENRARQIFLYLVMRPMMNMVPLKTETGVFSNYWGQKFATSDGPASVCLEFVKNPRHKAVVFAAKYKRKYIEQQVAALMPGAKNVKVVNTHSLSYYYHLWTAKYLFNDVNFHVGFRTDQYVGLRPGQVEVQTTHGIPMKKMGIDSDRAIEGSELRKFLAKSSRYTHLVSSSQYVAKIFSASHGVAPQILKTGLPQNDELFVKKTDDELLELKRKHGVDENKKIVLYAPTFRYGRGYAFRFLLDIHRMQEELGDEYQLLIKVHPFNHTHLGLIDFRNISDFAVEQINSPFVKLFGEVRIDDNYSPVIQTVDEVNTYPEKIDVDSDTNELMRISDVMISDYSSVMFNFTLLDKPVVLFTPDFEHYDSTRGCYFDIEEIAPGAVIKSNDDISSAIKKSQDPVIWNSEFGTRQTAFRDRFLEWESGQAAKQILASIGAI